MEQFDATTGGPAANTCPSCGGHPRWESLVDGEDERWLAVCRCGRIQAFMPDAPEVRPVDPLSAFLAGPEGAPAPASPPWIRVFLRSLEGPSPVRWSYRPGPCPRCGVAATFALSACPRPFVLASCTLCLACGHAAASYQRHSPRMQESPATGSAWTPPCPAVQRIRDCVFRPYAVLGADGRWRDARWEPEGAA